MTEQQMFDTINERIKELCANEKIQAQLRTLKTEQEKKDFLYHAAVSTLLGL